MSLHIEITLGGALIKYLPQGEIGNSFTLSTDTPLSLEQLLAQLGIGADQRLLTILNGQVIQPSVFGTTLMSNGDALSLMPPIVAG